jgi:hypothetical protein
MQSRTWRTRQDCHKPPQGTLNSVSRRKQHKKGWQGGVGGGESGCARETEDYAKVRLPVSLRDLGVLRLVAACSHQNAASSDEARRGRDFSERKQSKEYVFGLLGIFHTAGQSQQRLQRYVCGFSARDCVRCLPNACARNVRATTDTSKISATDRRPSSLCEPTVNPLSRYLKIRSVHSAKRRL